MWPGFIDQVRDLTAGVDRMLAPLEVLERCRELALRCARIERRIIGATEAGLPLEAYHFASVRPTEVRFLLYGFPDPGEPVGATGLTALLSGIADGHPLFDRLPMAGAAIPCLNLDDQPDGGRTLRHVFKSRAVRQVDLCADDPRAETRALLSLGDALRPHLTFALHDEYHSGEDVPAYIGTTRILPSGACDRMRQALTAFGVPLSSSEHHPEMGAGFVDDRRYGERYEKSAFARLDRHGPVLSCEVSDRPGARAADLVGAQLAVGLIALESVRGA